MLGAQTQQSYIPTPDAVEAKGVKYDELYPKAFRSPPATYIRFSSTVEDCIGITYCMNEDDAKFLEQLNDGKDVNGQPLKDKSSQCSDDAFEEVMNFFEESSTRMQPFANLDDAPVLSLEEMEQHREEASLSQEAQRFLKPIYQYWTVRKGSRSLMPTIKVRVLDTTSEADDADPYVCFRRREVRQTRKTRGRDAQVVEKIKKLRLELEQARQLIQMIAQREKLNAENLDISRKVFEQRKQLKDVKIAKNIVGEKGEDEDLLVNQKVRLPRRIFHINLTDSSQPVPKPKARPDGQRPATIRLRSGGDRTAPDSDLDLLSDRQAEAEAHVNHTIESRKEQHRRWNQHWQDKTWKPLTPPPEPDEQSLKWGFLSPEGTGYPTPPPSVPSRSSQDRDGDIDMADPKPLQDAMAGAEPQFSFFFPPPCSVDGYFDDTTTFAKRDGHPTARLRRGRGGRLHLEMRKARPKGLVARGVVSDSDSDDEVEDYFPVSDAKTFDYRCALNSRARPGPEGMGERRQWPSGDQTAMMAGAQQQQAASSAAHSQQNPPPQAAGGSSS